MSEEGLPKKGFKIAALVFLGISLIILTISALYFLLRSTSSSITKSSIPTLNIVNIIGSTILNIFGNNLLLLIALFYIIAAVLFGIGYFIKDKNDRTLYQSLIYSSWFILAIVLIYLSAISASNATIVGSWFLIYTSPIYLFAAYKGLYLINLIVNRFKS